MEEATATTAVGSSGLLWLVSALVLAMAVHVALGWVRRAQRLPGLRRQGPALLLAAGALGTGLCSAMLVSMHSAELPFRIGFDPLLSLLLWLLSVLVCLPVMRWQAAPSKPWWVQACSAAVLAVGAMGLQLGWVMAAGLRPGLAWRGDLVLTMQALTAIGLGLGLAAHGRSTAASHASKRRLWRLGGALLVALSFFGGQELLLQDGGLAKQRGSMNEPGWPGTALALIGGGLVPLVLAAMAAELAARGSPRTGKRNNFTPPPRPKRRRRADQR